MQHVYRIKSSQTWTCPKTGPWKVICVGGGASGGIIVGSSSIIPLQQAGGTTSFGNLLSALGGQVVVASPIADICGGYGGWDGINYGGSPAMIRNDSSWETASASGNGGVLGQAGIGNGAGGAFSNNSLPNTIDFLKSDGTTIVFRSRVCAVPGRCGEMVDSIFDLTENQSIACTVGTSTKPSVTAATLVTLAKRYDSTANSLKETELVTPISNNVIAGTNGIIYLEYLG